MEFRCVDIGPGVENTNAMQVKWNRNCSLGLRSCGPLSASVMEVLMEEWVEA